MESTPVASGAPLPASQSWFTTIRNALAGAQYDYTSGSINRGIAMLAIPMILEMVMESTFAVVDVYFVGRLGSAAVAAVGLTESILTMLYAVAIGLSMSVTATVARRIGEHDPHGAAVSAVQAVGLGICVSAVIGLGGGAGARALLGWMGASSEVLESGSAYAAILLGSNVVIVLLFINNAIFRGAGDAALAMRSLWLANGINIVLDPCLIFGWGPFPELGLTGAAVATTIGRGTGVLYQLWALGRGTGRVRLAGHWHVDLGAMWKLVRISLGGIGQFLIATASWVALVRIVAPFGDAAVAGYTIAVRILIFTILPSWGLSNAAATLTGQNLGAGQPDRAARCVWRTGLYNMLFLGLVAVVMITIPGTLIRVFTDEPEVIEVGVLCLRIISYGYLAYAWGMVMVQAFNGAGDTVTPTWINFVSFWLVEIPLAYTLARGADWGPAGVFWAIAVAESLCAVIAILVFRRGTWRTRTV
jgi:putative MATE family efflux protein